MSTQCHSQGSGSFILLSLTQSCDHQAHNAESTRSAPTDTYLIQHSPLYIGNIMKDLKWTVNHITIGCQFLSYVVPTRDASGAAFRALQLCMCEPQYQHTCCCYLMLQHIALQLRGQLVLNLHNLILYFSLWESNKF